MRMRPLFYCFLIPSMRTPWRKNHSISLESAFRIFINYFWWFSQKFFSEFLDEPTDFCSQWKETQRISWKCSAIWRKRSPIRNWRNEASWGTFTNDVSSPGGGRGSKPFWRVTLACNLGGQISADKGVQVSGFLLTSFVNVPLLLWLFLFQTKLYILAFNFIKEWKIKKR